MAGGVLEAALDLVVLGLAGVLDDLEPIGDQILGVPTHHLLFQRCRHGDEFLRRTGFVDRPHRGVGQHAGAEVDAGSIGGIECWQHGEGEHLER